MKTRYIAALAALAMVFVGFSAFAAEDSDAALGGTLMGYAEGNEAQASLPMQVFYYDDTKDYLKFDFGTVKPSSDFRVTLIDQTGEEGVKVINLVQTGAKAYAYVTLTAGSTYALTVDPINGSEDRTATLTIKQMVKVTYHDPVKGNEDVIQYLATEAALDQAVFTDDNATFAGYVAGETYEPLADDPEIVTAVPDAAGITDNTYDICALWTVDIVFNKTGASTTQDMGNLTAYLNASYQELTTSTYESDKADFAGWVIELDATLTEEDIIADEALITPDFFDGMTVTEKKVQLYAVYKIDVTYNGGEIEGVTITGETAAGIAYLYYVDAWKIFDEQYAAENGFVAPGYAFDAWQYVDETTVDEGGALDETAVTSNMSEKKLVLTATWEKAGYDVFISNIHVSTGAQDASKVTVKVRDLSGSALVEGTTAVVAGSYYAVDTDGDETVFIFGNIEDLGLSAATPIAAASEVSVNEFEVSLGTDVKPYWVYGQYVSDNTSEATVIAESYGVLLNENDTDYTVVTLTISPGTGQGTLTGITGAGNYFLGTEVTPAYTGTETVKFYEDLACTTEITGAVTLDGDKTIYYKVSA